MKACIKHILYQFYRTLLYLILLYVLFLIPNFFVKYAPGFAPANMIFIGANFGLFLDTIGNEMPRAIAFGASRKNFYTGLQLTKIWLNLLFVTLYFLSSRLMLRLFPAPLGESFTTPVPQGSTLFLVLASFLLVSTLAEYMSLVLKRVPYRLLKVALIVLTLLPAVLLLPLSTGNIFLVEFLPFGPNVFALLLFGVYLILSGLSWLFYRTMTVGS